MSRLTDRLFDRKTIESGPVKWHLSRFGPLAAVVQTLRDDTFATSIMLGRASIHVGMLGALEAGLHDAGEVAPIRVRWLRRDEGASGAIALIWDGGPKAATR